jgi:alkylation response protein AidB-like acyl-CoA dehydrogenase
MNFAPVDLDDESLEFWADVRSFFDEHVTEAVHEEERRNGGGFNEALHVAMGARGWVVPRWSHEDGGAEYSSLWARIISIEAARSKAPMILTSTTTLPPIAIRMFGGEEVKQTVLPGVADGTIRICLGYTEPDCGSDLAAVRTKAVRDGDEWVVEGQKMFTTGAQFCQYCFCLARTNPDVPKHKGLTVFLIPLDLPGVEIRPIGTLGGERTNFVHFDEVRVRDRYRLGDVNEGWTVVSAPLAQEHGMSDGADSNSGPLSPYLSRAKDLLDSVADWASRTSGPTTERLIDDSTIREQLSRAAVDIELARSTPGAMGRVLSSDLLMQTASNLLDLVGTEGLLSRECPGNVIDGAAGDTFCFAPGTGIYGGSTDIHRNLIAEHHLGLPRSTPRN